MSAKNDLQEYFQKRRLTLPVYESTRNGGEDHDPLWVAQLTICDGSIYTSRPCASKKKAELDVARTTYDEMLLIDEFDFGRPEPANKFKFVENQVVILIDAENQPNALGELVYNTRSTTGITFYAFYSNGHSFGKKISNLSYTQDNRVKFVSVPSTRKDGSDVGLLITVGAMVESSKFSSYIIVSNDHFAEAAADIIRGYAKMDPTYKKKKIKATACRDWKDTLLKLAILQSEGKW